MEKTSWNISNHETGDTITERAELTVEKARDAGKKLAEKKGYAVVVRPLGDGQAYLCYPTSTGVRSRPLGAPAPAAAPVQPPAHVHPAEAPCPGCSKLKEHEKTYVLAAVTIGLARAQELLAEVRERIRL